MNHIAKILSSNEDLDITQCNFNVKILSIPCGSKPNKIINLANDIRTKKCIMQIKNNVILCCPRAIITALTYHTNNIFGTKRNIKHIREGWKIQTKLTEELCKRLGNYNEEGFTLEDIKNVEELLDIQNKVVCAESFNAIIYSGEERETKIYLYRVSQEEWIKLREDVPYVKLYRYNPKHLYPKLNDYGDLRFIYEEDNQCISVRLGWQGAFKSTALWCVRAGKGLNLRKINILLCAIFLCIMSLLLGRIITFSLCVR